MTNTFNNIWSTVITSMQGPQHGVQGTTPTRWRIFAETGHTQGYIALTSVAFRSTSGGVDEAIKDNSIGDLDDNWRAFDNDHTTYASVAETADIWIGYVFPKAVKIREFALEKNTQFGSYMPKDFRLQYSDNGTNWTDGEVLTGISDWLVGYEIKEFEVTNPDTNGSHQYWRIYVDINNGNGTSTTISEVHFRDTIGGETLTKRGTASASSEDNGSAAFAFDDANTTAWGSLTDIDEWIEFEFTFPTIVVEVALESHAGFYYATAYPEDFRLEYYDGIEWISALRVTGASSTVKNQIQTYTI